MSWGRWIGGEEARLRNSAITNFEMSRYDVRSILDSATLLIGPPAKDATSFNSTVTTAANSLANSFSTTEGISAYNYNWPAPTIAFQQQQQQQYPPLVLQYYPAYSNFSHQHQPVIHNHMASCSTLLELSTGSNCDVYNQGAANVFVDDHEEKQITVENIIGWPTESSYRNAAAYYPALGVADHSAALMGRWVRGLGFEGFERRCGGRRGGKGRRRRGWRCGCRRGSGGWRGGHDGGGRSRRRGGEAEGGEVATERGRSRRGEAATEGGGVEGGAESKERRAWVS